MAPEKQVALPHAGRPKFASIVAPPRAAVLRCQRPEAILTARVMKLRVTPQHWQTRETRVLEHWSFWY
jgi:hypothetical protein